MADHWRNALVFFVLVAASITAATQTSGTHQSIPLFLPLICIAVFIVYKVASSVLNKSGNTPRVEFSFPVYVLRDSAGRVLCTEESNGGYLAVFTDADTARCFQRVRKLLDWSPAIFSHAEMLDVLLSARQSGRVQFVTMDPLVGKRGITPVFPLSRCIDRLSE